MCKLHGSTIQAVEHSFTGTATAQHSNTQATLKMMQLQKMSVEHMQEGGLENNEAIRTTYKRRQMYSQLRHAHANMNCMGA